MSKVKRIFGAITLVTLVSLVLFLSCVTGLKGMTARAETAAETEEEQIAWEIDEDAEFSTEEIIVVLDEETSRLDGTAAEAAENLFDRTEYSAVESLTKVSEPSEALMGYYDEHPYRQILSVGLVDRTEEGVREAVETLQGTDGILYAGPDYIEHAESVDEPDDPYFSELWGLTGTYGIDVTAAWEITQGDPDVRVGVIDTGIAEHEDLLNVAEGYDFYNEDSVTTDDETGHGTHVAGTIAAAMDNGIGVAGVAPEVTLVPLQACYNSDGKFKTSDLVEAISYAAGLWGTSEQISVLNYSISGFGESAAVLSAALDFPGLFVWAAGNETSCVDEYSSIAEYDADNIISVGAISRGGEIAEFSNYGEAVDVFAPGVDIYSTIPGGYGYKSGTSMAAPHVSGIAALLCSMDGKLTGAELKDLILDGAESYSYSADDGTYSSCRALAGNALSKCEEDLPECLGLKLVGKTDDGWRVRLTNGNSFKVYAAYNSKMCFGSDAKVFSDLSDIEDVAISANSSKTVTVSENGTAGYVAASIGYTLNGHHYRRVSYANGLSYSGSSYSMNSVLYNTVTEQDYPEVDEIPDCLTFTINGKSDGQWKVKINNPNSEAVEVTYNTKMCFKSDAQDYGGCTDQESITINANKSKTVYVSTNGTAGYITARIDYYYQGFPYSLVTYANKLKTSSTSANEAYCIIRHLPDGGAYVEDEI